MAGSRRIEARTPWIGTPSSPPSPATGTFVFLDRMAAWDKEASGSVEGLRLGF
jgi:hypothetical protein